MRKKIEFLLIQASQLIALYEKNNRPVPRDTSKAVQRIEWIAASLQKAEVGSLFSVSDNLSNKRQKEGIRNKKHDADKALYDSLIRENESTLETISPSSLARYVPLLETPEK
ncbi:hypothetical protein WH95_07975 [Kiloniella litopenaei]|uniref:Uncharacterized protein n=1 Tax=Kiloniella litopenaei TaxID=1549748 RepID=A0A0M2RDG1_9PROT|nr:hypothetical protein [Kiloniella litopenaei]KKJ77598.1 hypothetical protein WH95_07975 [Kiloniella litopenaei]